MSYDADDDRDDDDDDNDDQDDDDGTEGQQITTCHCNRIRWGATNKVIVWYDK